MQEQQVPYEKPGPPKGEAYGIAAVTQALEGVGFPASKDDLMKEAGSQNIEWTKGHEMKLRDVLQQIPDRQYDSMAGVVAAVSDVMEQEEAA